MVCVACLDQREKRGAQLPKAVGNDLNLDQYEFEALFSVILSNRCLDTGHASMTRNPEEPSRASSNPVRATNFCGLKIT